MQDRTAGSKFRSAFTFAGSDYSLAAKIAIGFALSLLVWALTAGAFKFPTSVSNAINFAEAINDGERWLQANVKEYTRAMSAFIGSMLSAIEEFLWFKPWPAITLAIALPALAYGGLRLALFTVAGVMFWGMMDMWDPAMSTLALMGVSVMFSVILGILVGIWCSQSDRVESFVRPILDAMQTMPSFVYLLPAIIFFGIGPASAAMAIIIYAMPPVVRLTNLGIRQVPETTIEAAKAFGSTDRQMLWKIQIPQALSSIMLGINQTIMMALGLAVLAVFIGAGGLGEEVWKALTRLKVGWSFEAGLCIVFMAIIFDRLSLAMSEPKHSDLLKDKTEMQFRLLPQRLSRNPVALTIEKGIDWIWNVVAAVAQFVTNLIAAAIAGLIGLINREFSQIMRGWLRNRTLLVSGLVLIFAILAWDAWISSIGFFPRDWQFTIRAPVDDAVEWLVVNPAFIGFTTGLRAGIYLYVLNPLEQFIIGLPWFYVLATFFLIVWASAGTSLAVVTFGFLFFTGAAGLWDITMQTFAATVASVVICIVIGLPFGIWAAYSKTVDSIIRPILDTMQTMPAFVYLIPVLMFFGGNKVTAIIATVIYALPPLVRMTILGLRQLPPEINEVSNSFGSTQIQSLIKVKLPMASPSIMLGINQSVIMALAMQAIAPLVAGEGLGKEVFHAMSTADTGRGLVAGVGIVLLAIMLDRLTQAWTKNQRNALGL